MHNFLYFISHLQEENKWGNVKENAVMTHRADFWLGREGNCQWDGTSEVSGDDGVPPKPPSCPQIAACNIPIRVAGLGRESAMCQGLCLTLYVLYLSSSTLIPILKTRWNIKLRKPGLAKWREGQLPSKHVTLAWGFPSSQSLVSILQLQDLSPTSGTFIHSTNVC